jgi:hypothetical protein
MQCAQGEPRLVAQASRCQLSASGNWFITPHAVERYRERVAPRMAYEMALWCLVQLSMQAHRVRDKAPGIEMWRGPKPERLRFLVATGNSGLPQLLTVLKGHDRG